MVGLQQLYHKSHTDAGQEKTPMYHWSCIEEILFYVTTFKFKIIHDQGVF